VSASALAIPRAALLPALERACTFQNPKLAVNTHVLGHVWLTAEGRALFIEATDGVVDVWCRVGLQSLVEYPFACGVPAKKFLEVVRRLPDAPITLARDVEGGKLRLRSGRATASLPTLPLEDRPAMARMPDEEEIYPVHGKTLAAAVASVLPSAGDDEPLDQVRFTQPDTPDGSLVVEATCGHEFVRVLVPRHSSEPGESWAETLGGSFGVDPRTLAVTARWIEGADRIATTPKRLFFADALGWWSLPVRRGQWPDTEQFLHKLYVPGASSIDLPAAALAEACARLAVLLPDKVKGLLLDAAGPDVRLYLDGGCGVETVEAARLVSGPGVRAVVPAKGLSSLVSRAPGEWVRLTMSGPFAPVGVRALADAPAPGGHHAASVTVRPDWQAITMPMQAPLVEDFTTMEEGA
jgi:hypothetical protein